MEPKILMIGRTQEVIDILIAELRIFGRDIVGSNDKDILKRILENKKIDFVIIGAGLPDEARNDMNDYLLSIQPGLVVNQIEKTDKSNPYQLISFTNQKAVEWKVEQRLGKRPTGMRK